MSYKFLGNDDTVTTCDCCGRINLKSTVALESGGGDILHYGITCAARALKTTAKVVKSEAKLADDAKRAAVAAERDRASREEYARFQTWLDANAAPTLRGDRFRQIESLGGFAKANTAYEAFRREVTAAR